MENTKTQNQPVAAAAEATTKIKQTPVQERLYRLVSKPSVAPKGKQRQIVLDILEASKKPMTVAEVTKIATEKGLTAVGGVGPSCSYHLHHLVLLKIVEVTNPTITVEVKKPAETKAA